MNYFVLDYHDFMIISSAYKYIIIKNIYISRKIL